MKFRPTGVIGLLVVFGAVSCANTGGPPDREPEVTGVVAFVDEREGPVLTGASDDYYDGMRLFPQDSVALTGTGGERLSPEQLENGDRVEVWVGDACAESDPVQCKIDAVRLLDE